MTSKCTWFIVGDTETIYETSCNHTHEFLCQGVDENQYKYCPYCGKSISTEPTRRMATLTVPHYNS